MDPRKLFSSNEKAAVDYLCEESRAAWKNFPITRNLRSMTQMRAVIDSENVVVRRHIKKHLNSEHVDTIEKWLRRMVDMQDIFELAILGGDLEPTNEWRVLEGVPVFHGTEQECRDYINGSHFTFRINEEVVSQEDDWNHFLLPDGRVKRNLEEVQKNFALERKWYDSVDDFEIWHDS